ncbi:DUF7793 family protein [Ferruginibacter sp.]
MEHENPYVHLYIKDQILVGDYKEKLHINLEIAKEIVKWRLEFTGGKPMATMILSHGITSMDRPARTYLSSPEATVGLIATAIVIDSEFQRIVGNFFIAVNRTAMPVRLFKNPASAQKWLKKFIQ